MSLLANAAPVVGIEIRLDRGSVSLVHASVPERTLQALEVAHDQLDLVEDRATWRDFAGELRERAVVAFVRPRFGQDAGTRADSQRTGDRAGRLRDGNRLTNVTRLRREHALGARCARRKERREVAVERT